MNSLEALFEEKIAILEEKILAYPIENREMYCKWLCQQFFLVENSTRYLTLSASKVPTESREEFREWVHHLGEELDHDALVLKDLKKLDYNHRDPILPLTRAIVATQYYDIEKYGQNALLGYALMLEGLSCRVCEPLADRAEAAHGKGTAIYLRLHANVDKEHYPEGLVKIRSLPADQAQIVAMNLETMFELYVGVLESLLKNPSASSSVSLVGTTAPELQVLS
jgi:hypothetical protein